MLMFAVLDPLAFEKENFDNPTYLLQIKIFLKGVLSNGLLILDPNGQLREKIMSLIPLVPIKYRQQVNILVEEIFIKNKKKKTICCHQKAFSNKNIPDLREMAVAIKNHCGVDAIITNEKGKLYLATKGISVSDVVTLESYDESEFEKKRNWFFGEMPPIDSVPEQFEGIIVRIVKFARWLCFYDKQINKGNPFPFRKGIEYILRQWKQHGYFASRQNLTEKLVVDIITGDVISDRRPLEVIKGDYEKVKSNLLEPLKRIFPDFQINLSLKNDANTRITHARHLQTQGVNIFIDLGFDIFHPNTTTLRRLILKIDNGSSVHLKEYRELPEIDFNQTP